MSAQDSRSRDAVNELAPPHEGAPVHLEIPLGTPDLQGPGVMGWLIGRWLTGGKVVGVVAAMVAVISTACTGPSVPPTPRLGAHKP